MKTIVALIDFSDLTFKILKQAHTLAKAFDSEVVLLHVTPPQPVVMGVGIASPTMLREPSPEEVALDEQKLSDLAESLAKFGVKTAIVRLEGATVATVLEETSRLLADLIIVGTHGHGPLYNLLVGTATAGVLKHAPCPVLVVPAASATPP